MDTYSFPLSLNDNDCRHCNDSRRTQIVLPNESLTCLLNSKIDLYMKLFIIPHFDPSKICWWLSLSGGKDSYAMAHLLRYWYREKGIKFNARGFFINQWGGMAAANANDLVDWLPISVIDARADTINRTGYVDREQAPCRTCSDVRHDITDQHLDNEISENGYFNFIARGLHLSDIATSLVWRFFRGMNPFQAMRNAGKGKPIANIGYNRYLAKPLFFIREYETQRYSENLGFKHACCGCPACRYPPRRDIVEETLLSFFESELWEFDVPGMCDFLNGFGPHIDIGNLRAASLPGLAVKNNRLPEDFIDYSFNRFTERLSVIALSSLRSAINFNHCLDDFGFSALEGGAIGKHQLNIPAPAMLVGGRIGRKAKNAIAALGPFWAAFCLPMEKMQEALNIQKALYGIQTDDILSNVHEMLIMYYKDCGT